MHPASSVSHYTKLLNLTFTVSVETANSGSNPVLEISPLVDWPYNVATEFVGGVSDQGTGCWKTQDCGAEDPSRLQPRLQPPALRSDRSHAATQVLYS